MSEFQLQASAHLPSPKLGREISSLRRFLQKNQEHTFTEREKQKLFTAIQEHFSNPAAVAIFPGAEPPVLALIEDALKMPFSVFTTAHKQQMLKWLERLRGADRPVVAAAAPAPKLSGQAIDLLPDGTLSLIQNDGSSIPDMHIEPSSAMFGGIAASLGRGACVSVVIAGSVVESWHEDDDDSNPL